MRVISDLRDLGPLTPGNVLLTADGTDGGTPTLAANGTSSAVVRYRGPADGKVWVITSLSLLLIGTSSTAYDPTSLSAVASASVGAGAAIQMHDGDETIEVVNLQNNGAIAQQASVYREVTSLTTNDYLAALFNFTTLLGGHLPLLRGSAGEVMRVSHVANLLSIVAGNARIFYLEADER